MSGGSTFATWPDIGRARRTRVKVCCIASKAEADLAVFAGADAVGLVGAMPSGPGPIPDDDIAAIAAATPPPVATFLLTSETLAKHISAHVKATRPTCVQIVAHIALEEARALAELEPRISRLQVIHVEDDDALDLIDVYSPFVDAFLLDSGRPSAPVAELGGTGRVHDWKISAEFVRRSRRPVFLAGGLTPANVGEAIATVRPYGLDLCSGLRTNGALDRQKLFAFMDAVRRGDERAAQA
jgi:phosphoribosylanthranilate isomerase